MRLFWMIAGVLLVAALFSLPVHALNVSGSNMTIYYQNATALGESLAASCFDNGNHTQYGLSGVWYAQGEQGSLIELGSGRTYARGLQFASTADYFRFVPDLNYTQVISCTSADGRNVNVTANLYVLSPGNVNWMANVFFVPVKAPTIILLGMGLMFMLFVILSISRLGAFIGWLKKLIGWR